MIHAFNLIFFIICACIHKCAFIFKFALPLMVIFGFLVGFVPEEKLRLPMHAYDPLSHALPLLFGTNLLEKNGFLLITI